MKKEIAKYMKRLCDSGLTTSLGGNISCLTKEGIFVTPSGIDKYELLPDDIIKLSFDGQVIDGKNEPSIESMMHVKIYEMRDDIGAIVHAHPLFTTLLSASNEKINIAYTAEALKNLKYIEYSKFQLMGSQELANVVSTAARNANIVIMENHGAVTLGKTLLEAFYRMELLENAAKMSFYSRFLDVNELANQEKERICKL